MIERRNMIERRANWVVLVRVHEKSDWCAYGPMTHREALAFRRAGIGAGMDRQVAQLIQAPKQPEHAAAPSTSSEEKS